MSYVYKYKLKQIKNFLIEKEQITCEEQYSILSSIEKNVGLFFKFDLKMCYVGRENESSDYYIKFDLWSPMDCSKSRRFHNYLKNNVTNYGKDYVICKTNNDYYAIVCSEEDEFVFELLDSSVLDGIASVDFNDSFDKRIHQYLAYGCLTPIDDFEDVHKTYYYQEIDRLRIKLRNIDDKLNIKMKYNLFLPLLNLDDKCKDAAERLLGRKINEGLSIFKIKGQLRGAYTKSKDIENRIVLKNNHDTYVLNYLNNVNEKRRISDGYFKAYLDISNCSEEYDKIKKYEELKEKIHIDFKDCTGINVPAINNKEKLKFTVHNVGQALSTSLAVENNMPFLYFDYGNKNKQSLTIEDKETTIVISHNHKDHWNGLSKTLISQIYPKEVCLMDDDQMPDMNQILVDLYLEGVNVSQIRNNIVLSNIGYLIPIPMSKMTYKGKNNLNSGIMYINYGDKRILVPGDQIYDNVDCKYYTNLNVLVATHHGLTYGKVIPLNTHNGEIIYSFKSGGYNKNVNNKLPNKAADYKKENWKIYHKTFDYADGYKMDL